MKRSITILSVIVLTITVFAACGKKQESAQKSGSAQKTMVLKLGHIANLEQPYHIAAEKFARDVFERTNGAIEIQVFPNSQLGGQRELLEGIQLGAIDIVFTSSAVLGNFIPTAQVIDLPFIFRDSEHVYHAVDGPLAKEIYAGDEKLGMKIISTWENGFRNVGNNVRSVHVPGDMKAIKIRVLESQLYIDMFELLGAIPTPMAMSEVFTALQQKTIDGIENPMIQIYASKYYEVLKYLTLTEHTYSPQIVVFSLDTWNQISPENQKIILESATECRDYNRSLTAEKTKEYLEKMKEQGVEIVELSPEQKDVFKTMMLPVWEPYYKIVGKELVDKVANAK
jgi:tripartite ATP-independent transporter DctP family solute receptor